MVFLHTTNVVHHPGSVFLLPNAYRVSGHPMGYGALLFAYYLVRQYEYSDVCLALLCRPEVKTGLRNIGFTWVYAPDGNMFKTKVILEDTVRSAFFPKVIQG